MVKITIPLCLIPSLSPTERVDTTELTLPEQLKVYMRYSEELPRHLLNYVTLFVHLA